MKYQVTKVYINDKDKLGKPYELEGKKSKRAVIVLGDGRKASAFIHTKEQEDIILSMEGKEVELTLTEKNEYLNFFVPQVAPVAVQSTKKELTLDEYIAELEQELAEMGVTVQKIKSL